MEITRLASGHPDLVIPKITPPLEWNHEDKFLIALKEAVRGKKRIILEMLSFVFISSDALNILVKSVGEIRENIPEAQFHLVANPHALRKLQQMGFHNSELWMVYDNLGAALDFGDENDDVQAATG